MWLISLDNDLNLNWWNHCAGCCASSQRTSAYLDAKKKCASKNWTLSAFSCILFGLWLCLEGGTCSVLGFWSCLEGSICSTQSSLWWHGERLVTLQHATWYYRKGGKLWTNSPSLGVDRMPSTSADHLRLCTFNVRFISLPKVFSKRLWRRSSWRYLNARICGRGRLDFWRAPSVEIRLKRKAIHSCTLPAVLHGCETRVWTREFAIVLWSA